VVLNTSERETERERDALVCVCVGNELVGGVLA
jgi:hypothetical protein